VARKAELHHRLPPGLPPIEGDGAQIAQVVMNLITNAAEAIGAAGGRIDVSTGSMPVTRNELDSLLLGEGLPEGLYVHVEVTDTGCGMTSETRARIFDPFFTTKFTGRGLGLAAVLGIVRAHRGAIEIASEPGRGTSFRVLFPASARAERAAPPEPGAEDSRAADRGMLLVVDDDPGVLEVIAETLARVGFDVLRASDGATALALFREHADEIRVVLLDLNMPGASGEDVCDEIRRLRPNAKIILISGYSQDRSPAHAKRPWLAGFLQKPFLPSTLLAKVRALLDA
jgi:CheY-like chemotaxis protein